MVAERNKCDHTRERNTFLLVNGSILAVRALRAFLARILFLLVSASLCPSLCFSSSAAARPDECKPSTTAPRNALAARRSRRTCLAASLASLSSFYNPCRLVPPSATTTPARSRRGIDIYEGFLIHAAAVFFPVGSLLPRPSPHGRISILPPHPQWPPIYDNSGLRKDSSGSSVLRRDLPLRNGLTWHSHQVPRTPGTPACIVAATIPWVHWKSRVQSG
ncbi:uncharacterized protein LOC143903733 [Temnothorax americanus]|uniref:uncharacterized protein LOC143903733 n=1 Tax=Temnothorax americanus TaxID=1964332 RepID=UPI00406878C2